MEEAIGELAQLGSGMLMAGVERKGIEALFPQGKYEGVTKACEIVCQADGCSESIARGVGVSTIGNGMFNGFGHLPVISTATRELQSSHSSNLWFKESLVSLSASRWNWNPVSMLENVLLYYLVCSLLLFETNGFLPLLCDDQWARNCKQYSIEGNYSCDYVCCG